MGQDLNIFNVPQIDHHIVIPVGIRNGLQQFLLSGLIGLHIRELDPGSRRHAFFLRGSICLCTLPGLHLSCCLTGLSHRHTTAVHTVILVLSVAVPGIPVSTGTAISTSVSVGSAAAAAAPASVISGAQGLVRRSRSLRILETDDLVADQLAVLVFFQGYSAPDKHLRILHKQGAVALVHLWKYHDFHITDQILHIQKCHDLVILGVFYCLVRDQSSDDCIGLVPD